MRDLAEVRLEAARLSAQPETTTSEALDIARRALDLADTIRKDAAAMHQRCLVLERDVDLLERRAESVFDMVPIAVVTTSTAGAVLYANPAACTLLARGKVTLQRDPLMHFAEDREAFAATVGQLSAATAPIDTTLRLRPCNRAPVAVRITIVRDTADAGRFHWYLQPLVPGCPPIDHALPVVLSAQRHR
jgi:PAS domain-containing protein